MMASTSSSSSSSPMTSPWYTLNDRDLNNCTRHLYEYIDTYGSDPGKFGGIEKLDPMLLRKIACMAAAFGKLELFEELLKQAPDLDLVNTSLGSSNIDPNKINSDAIWGGKTGIVRPYNMEGATPLHWAVAFDRFAMMAFLIKSGAKVDAVDKAGRTALTLLIQKKVTPPHFLEALVAANADPQLYHIRKYTQRVSEGGILCASNHLHTLINNENLATFVKLVDYNWQRQYEPLLIKYIPEIPKVLCPIIMSFLPLIVEDVPLYISPAENKYRDSEKLGEFETLLSLSIRTYQPEAIKLLLDDDVNPLVKNICLPHSSAPVVGLDPQSAIEFCQTEIVCRGRTLRPKAKLHMLELLNASRFVQLDERKVTDKALQMAK